MSKEAFKKQIPIPTSTAQQKKITIIVAPAPIIGLRSADVEHEKFIKGGTPTERLPFRKGGNENWDLNHNRSLNFQNGFAEWDAEAYVLNNYAWDTIINRIVPLENVVVLSGDVHYAYSARVDCFDNSEANNHRKSLGAFGHGHDPNSSSFNRLKLMQCTSSSAKNENFSTKMVAVSHALKSGKGLGPWDYCALQINENDEFYKKRGHPYEIPIPSRIIGTTDPRLKFFENTDKMNAFEFHTYPPRVYNYEQLEDSRDEEYRSEDYDDVDNFREVLPLNNIGLVRFEWNTLQKRVTHILLYRYYKDDPVRHTIHEMDFKLSPTTPYITPPQ